MRRSENKSIYLFVGLTAGLSALSAAAVYLLTRDMTVVVIAGTKVRALPVVDYLWPVAVLTLLGTAIICSLTVAVLKLWVFIRPEAAPRDIEREASSYDHLRDDLRRISEGDLTRMIEFRDAGGLRPAALDVEKLRTELKRKITLINDRHNAIKHFLDQRGFEVNAENRELLKKRLQQLDEVLKEFTIRSSAGPVVEPAAPMVHPQPDRIVKDAEEMIKP